MKKIMIIMICWASTLAVYAQDTLSSNASTGTNEIHTLFHKGSGSCKIPLGFFFELNEEYTHLGHKSFFLPGMSMGLILNHHWTIGMTGNFIPNSQGFHSQGNHKHQEDNDSTSARKHGNSLQGGYGGLLLEYILFPQSRIHVSFPLTIGSGYIYHSHLAHRSDSTDTDNKWSHHGDSFFVIEPGVKLEINVIKHLRIDLGISYRYSPERDHRVTSPDLLNQLTGKLTIRFGKF
jgi:hypothetical protein